jgi:hypothetical protein
MGSVMTTQNIIAKLLWLAIASRAVTLLRGTSADRVERIGAYLIQLRYRPELRTTVIFVHQGVMPGKWSCLRYIRVPDDHASCDRPNYAAVNP